MIEIIHIYIAFLQYAKLKKMNSNELIKLLRDARRDINTKPLFVPYWRAPDELLNEVQIINKNQYNFNKTNAIGNKRHMESIGAHEPIAYVDVMKHLPKFTEEDEIHVIHYEEKNWPMVLKLNDKNTLPKHAREKTSLFIFADWYVDHIKETPIQLLQELPVRPPPPKPDETLWKRCVEFMRMIRYRHTDKVTTIEKFKEAFMQNQEASIREGFDAIENLLLEIEAFTTVLRVLLVDITDKLNRDERHENSWRDEREKILQENKERNAVIQKSIQKKIDFKNALYAYFKTIKKPCPCGCSELKRRKIDSPPPHSSSSSYSL